MLYLTNNQVNANQYHNEIILPTKMAKIKKNDNKCW